MGGYLPTEGVKLTGSTVIQKDKTAEDYDLLRKLIKAVAEMETYITANETAIARTSSPEEINMRTAAISMTQARMAEYRAKITDLDEGWLN